MELARQTCNLVLIFDTKNLRDSICGWFLKSISLMGLKQGQSTVRYSPCAHKLSLQRNNLLFKANSEKWKISCSFLLGSFPGFVFTWTWNGDATFMLSLWFPKWLTLSWLWSLARVKLSESKNGWAGITLCFWCSQGAWALASTTASLSTTYWTKDIINSL